MRLYGLLFGLLKLFNALLDSRFYKSLFIWVFSSFRNMVIAIITMLMTTIAVWAYAVSDATTHLRVAELIESGKEQYKLMSEELGIIKQINDFANDTFQAIGEAGSLSIPDFAGLNMQGELLRNLKCLGLNYEDMFPSLNLDGLNLSTICQVKDLYRSALWVDEEKYLALPPSEQNKMIKELERTRQSLFNQTVSNGISQADIGAQGVDVTIKAANEASNNVRSATTQNDRLNVIAQNQVLILREMANQKAIAAQNLKVNSLLAMKMGVAPAELFDGNMPGANNEQASDDNQQLNPQDMINAR